MNFRSDLFWPVRKFQPYNLIKQKKKQLCASLGRFNWVLLLLQSFSLSTLSLHMISYSSRPRFPPLSSVIFPLCCCFISASAIRNRMCFIYSHPASHLPPSFPLRTAWCRWTALRTLSDWPKKNIPKKEAERRKEDDDMNAERNRGCWATLTDTDLYNTNIWVFFHLSCRTKLKHLLTDVIFIPLLVSEFVKCVIQLTHFVTSCF